MSLEHESLSAALAALSKGQIKQAGQRYSPGVNPQAPNLKIESLVTAIENLACGTDALSRFKTVVDSFFDAWGHAKPHSQRANEIQRMANESLVFLLPMMERLLKQDEGAAHEWSEKICAIETELLVDMSHWRVEEEKLRISDKGSGYSSAANTTRSNLNLINKCLVVIRDEKEFIQSPAFKVLFDPQLVISN